MAKVNVSISVYVAPINVIGFVNDNKFLTTDPKIETKEFEINETIDFKKELDLLAQSLPNGEYELQLVVKKVQEQIYR